MAQTDPTFDPGLSAPPPPVPTAASGSDSGAGGNVVPFPPQQQSTRQAVQQAVAQEWASAGYPAPAVNGIMRRVQAESSFDPRNIGDGGTSFGLYQHHGDRAVRLREWTQQHGLNPADPVAQTKFAIAEMAGLDPIAARHRGELMAAKDDKTAYGIFTSSFERPAGAPGSEETNLRSTTFGNFNANASAILGRWQADMDRRGKDLDQALAQSRDLHSASRAALAKWMTDSDKPPQQMREAWSQWGVAAGALALIGGLGGRHATASLAAAGAMMQGANEADAQAYNRNYKLWKDHQETGLKLIELIDKEARDIVDDSRKSYDAKLGELQILSSVYSLQQHLDPNSVDNISKNLQIAKTRSDLIKAQNEETEIRLSAEEKNKAWLTAHPEAGDKVPASVSNQHLGEAKRERSGTVTRPQQAKEIEVVGVDHKVVRRGAAYQTADGSWLWVGTNEPVDVPQGGNVNLKSTQQPRSTPAIYISKYMEENPNASADEISHANALFRADSTFAAGPEGRNTTALNTLADHLPLYEKYFGALQTGNVQMITAALQRLQAETGHSEITNFELAKNFLSDEAVRVMVPGGSAGALADREEMKKNLKASMSGEQGAGVVDVIREFTHGKLQALRQQYGRGDSKREDYFNTHIVTPEARRLFDAPGGVPPEGGPPVQGGQPGPTPGPVIRYDLQGNRVQ